MRKLLKQIEDQNAAIAELKKEEGEQQSKWSKMEEEIQLHKASKKFLDLLSIASKIKRPVNQKKRRKIKAIQE